MMRFLREHAELITTVCVVLSLLLGGTLLWLKKHGETLPDPVEVSTPTPVTTVTPAVTATDSKTDKADKHTR